MRHGGSAHQGVAHHLHRQRHHTQHAALPAPAPPPLPIAGAGRVATAGSRQALLAPTRASRCCAVLCAAAAVGSPRECGGPGQPAAHRVDGAVDGRRGGGVRREAVAAVAPCVGRGPHRGHAPPHERAPQQDACARPPTTTTTTTTTAVVSTTNNYRIVASSSMNHHQWDTSPTAHGCRWDLTHAVLCALVVCCTQHQRQSNFDKQPHHNHLCHHHHQHTAIVMSPAPPTAATSHRCHQLPLPAPPPLHPSTGSSNTKHAAAAISGRHGQQQQQQQRGVVRRARSISSRCCVTPSCPLLLAPPPCPPLSQRHERPCMEAHRPAAVDRLLRRQAVLQAASLAGR
jgi:hypothetical protein